MKCYWSKWLYTLSDNAIFAKHMCVVIFYSCNCMNTHKFWYVCCHSLKEKFNHSTRTVDMPPLCYDKSILHYTKQRIALNQNGTNAWNISDDAWLTIDAYVTDAMRLIMQWCPFAYFFFTRIWYILHSVTLLSSSCEWDGLSICSSFLNSPGRILKF